jgi:hypothetical protein
MGLTALLPLWRKCALKIVINHKNPLPSAGPEPHLWVPWQALVTGPPRMADWYIRSGVFHSSGYFSTVLWSTGIWWTADKLQDLEAILLNLSSNIISRLHQQLENLSTVSVTLWFTCDFAFWQWTILWLLAKILSVYSTPFIWKMQFCFSLSSYFHIISYSWGDSVLTNGMADLCSFSR